jgi:hypothetical protein
MCQHGTVTLRAPPRDHLCMANDSATPAPSPYPLPAAREAIVLHEGALELRHDGNPIAADGRLQLEVVPSLRFRFVIPDSGLAAPFTGRCTLSIPEIGASAPAFVTNFQAGGVIRGSLDTSSAGTSSDIVEVRFLVANLPDFMGTTLASQSPLPTGGSQRSYWAGRLELNAGDWRIALDERLDSKEVYARLKDEGGFEITHIGSLSRAGGRAFSETDASEVLNTLAGFLGVASGAWAPPAAAVGLDGDGSIVWREWNSRWTSPWISRVYPFDRRRHDLRGAFPGYAARWADPLWNEPLRIATQMYVEANGQVAADITLVVGQALLELISWVLFVEELQTHAAAAFDNVRASDRLRELLNWIGISPAVPASLAALRQEAMRHGWADGPHAISEMRNSLVHPPRRQRLTGTSVHARIDLRELVLWYAELAFLRLIDYRAQYANRLGAKMTGVAEDVPWK